MNCKTDGAIYEIEIRSDLISCAVYLPPNVARGSLPRLLTHEREELRRKIHDAMEAALAPLFPQYPPALMVPRRE